MLLIYIAVYVSDVLGLHFTWLRFYIGECELPSMQYMMHFKCNTLRAGNTLWHRSVDDGVTLTVQCINGLFVSLCQTLSPTLHSTAQPVRTLTHSTL